MGRSFHTGVRKPPLRRTLSDRGVECEGSMERVRISVTERVSPGTLNEVGETAALAAYLNEAFQQTRLRRAAEFGRWPVGRREGSGR